jgi:hypothetical protein
MAQGFTRGTPIDTDPNLALDSDLVVPSQKAIKDYVDTGLNTKQDTLTDTKSVKIVTGNVELDGDLASPGVNKVYGTGSSGTKGWKNDPVSPMGLIPGSIVGTFPGFANAVCHIAIPSADRFWITSAGSGRVDVYQASTGYFITGFLLTNATGVMYISSINEVWVTQSSTGTIRRYNPTTGVNILPDITGSGNGGIECVEISSTKVYIANPSSANITEINPSTLTVVATIAAATLGTTAVTNICYVNNGSSLHNGYLAGVSFGDSEFFAINTATNAVVISGTTVGGALNGGTSIDYNPVNDRYYIASYGNNRTLILNPNTSSTVIVDNYFFSKSPRSLACDPSTGLIYVSSLMSLPGSNFNGFSIVQCFTTSLLNWATVTPSDANATTYYYSWLCLDTVNKFLYVNAVNLTVGTNIATKLKI